jgi:hypothetical protein
MQIYGRIDNFTVIKHSLLPLYTEMRKLDFEKGKCPILLLHSCRQKMDRRKTSKLFSDAAKNYRNVNEFLQYFYENII